jgi:hypothetical protein
MERGQSEIVNPRRSSKNAEPPNFINRLCPYAPFAGRCDDQATAVRNVVIISLDRQCSGRDNKEEKAERKKIKTGEIRVDIVTGECVRS